MSRELLVRLRHGSTTLHQPMFLEAGFYSNDAGAATKDGSVERNASAKDARAA